MGILIAIEGVDGSGKETQTKRLIEKLEKDYKVKGICFPDYESPSSGLVKMYLNGDFGQNAKDVNAYVASTFYAVDRYASFNTKWKDFYNDGGIIVADRYASANMVHQAGKISDLKEKDKFLSWVNELEYEFYKIPKPDIVFFLDVPIEYRNEIVKGRKNKITGKDTQDIHEKDQNHLKESYESAQYVVEKFSWKKINCILDGKLRSIEDINNEIYVNVLKMIESRAI